MAGLSLSALDHSSTGAALEIDPLAVANSWSTSCGKVQSTAANVSEYEVADRESTRGRTRHVRKTTTAAVATAPGGLHSNGRPSRTRHPWLVGAGSRMAAYSR